MRGSERAGDWAGSEEVRSWARRGECRDSRRLLAGTCETGVYEMMISTSAMTCSPSSETSTMSVDMVPMTSCNEDVILLLKD